jgi:oligosaccharyltransferase complex subunit gamma
MNNTLTVSLLTIIIIIILLQSTTTTTAAHNDRLAKLTALTKAGKGVAPLNDKLYDEILSGPRNFSVTLLLTALGSQFQCQPCQ